MGAGHTSSQGRATTTLLTFEPLAGLSWGWGLPLRLCLYLSCPEISHGGANSPLACNSLPSRLHLPPLFLLTQLICNLSYPMFRNKVRTTPSVVSELRFQLLPQAELRAPGEPLNDTIRWVSSSPHERWRNRSEQWQDFKNHPASEGLSLDLMMPPHRDSHCSQRMGQVPTSWEHLQCLSTKQLPGPPLRPTESKSQEAGPMHV